MIKFFSGAQHISTSSLDFGGAIPPDIEAILAYDANVYTSAHAGVLGTPLTVPKMNSKRVTLHGKNGFLNYVGMTMYIQHIKPNFSLDSLQNWLFAVPISVYDDRTISNKITIGDYKA